MTLALLLTAVTGAWAQAPTIYFQQDYTTETVDWSTGTGGRYTPIIEDGYLTVTQNQRQNNGTTLTSTATQGKVDAGKDFTMTFNVKLGASTNQSATAFNIYDAANSAPILSFAEGSVNATAWKINQGTQTATVSAGGGKSLNELSWIFVQVTYIAGENAKTYLTLKDEQNNIIDGFDKTEIPTLSVAGGLGKMTFVTSRYAANFAIDNVLVCDVVNDAAASEPAVEVTTNAASKQDLFTEAWFNMPTYDATAEYELVRDLAQQTSVNLIIGTGDAATTVTADTRLRIVKNNNVYVPISALSCTFSDAIVGNTILPTGFNDAKLTPQFYLQGEDEEWTLVTDINTTTHLPNNLQPGQVYCMTLKAAEGSYYDGETPKSFTITLFQGYEVTVGAREYATFFKDEPLCADATTSADAELYTITEVTATEAVLSSKIDVVPSETPMLIYNPNEVEKTFLLIPTTENADAVTAADQFQGTLVDKTFTDVDMQGTDYYVCTGKAFVWVKSAGTIAANRCWLEIVAQPAGARANTRSIVSGGDTTNIDATTRDALEGDYYDLQGRKVEKPLRKGIYIKSGKKVIKH